MMKISSLVMILSTLSMFLAASATARAGLEYRRIELECKFGGCCSWMEISYYDGRPVGWISFDCYGEFDSGTYVYNVGTGGGSGTPTHTGACGTTMWASWITHTADNGLPMRLIGQDCAGEYYIAITHQQ